MRFFVYAYENMYGGLHGMYTFDIVHADSIEEANDYGKEMSYDVIQTYGSIMESLEDEIDPDIEEDSEEWEEALEEAIGCDTAWEVYEINEEVAHDVSDFILSMRFTGDVEEFIDNYCKKPDEKN